MSERPRLLPIRERLVGKWQIPLLLVSAALLVGSLLQIETPEARTPFETLVQRIEAQIAGQMYRLAIGDCRKLLGTLQDRPEAEARQGRVHLLLARALALQADQLRRHTQASAREVIAAYQRAQAAGQQLAWHDHRHLGGAQEALDRFDAAVASYESALADPGVGPEALDIRKRVLELMRYPLEAPAEQMHAALDAFLADARPRPDLMQWAVTRKVDLFSSEGRSAEALALLEDLRPAFEPTAYREPFEYVVAWVLYQVGSYDEAEGRLRSLRNRLKVRNDVYAMSGWLLGRVVLRDDGPQRPAEALSFFREVVDSQATGLYADASRLGMGEALAMLERFGESLEQYKRVIDSLDDYTDSPILNREVVRASMTVVAEQLRKADRFETGLAFLASAATLVDPDDVELMSTYLQLLGDWRSGLARSLRRRAEQLPEKPEHETRRSQLYDRARGLFALAGETFLELAHINTLNEPRSAAATWQAADRFDEAGERLRTVAVLREFVRERPLDELAPRALSRLGQSLQALGRYEEAIEAYQENLRRFARTPDAGSALVPLARCFMALGSEYYDQAEKTCRLILEDSPIFTPQAPEFADALFLMADLLSRQGRYEEAIPRLQEAITRTPDDARVVQAEFLLGDAYRQSGLALREDLKNARFVGEKPRLWAEHVRRLEKAGELFGRLVVRYQDREAVELDELERLFLRYARLYEADCLFELGRYTEALKRYERAAWIYRDTPSMLAAYVQIVNCHAYLGQRTESRAALRRAQYLLKTIPEEQFADATLTGTRADWEQYFTWLEQSELF